MIRLLFAAWILGDLPSELPRSGWAFLGVLVITAPVMLTAAGTLVVVVRQHRNVGQAAASRKEVSEIKSQVVNGHDDPMRFDLDKVIKKQDATDKKIDALVALAPKIDGLIVSVAEISGEMRGLTHRVDQIGK